MVLTLKNNCKKLLIYLLKISYNVFYLTQQNLNFKFNLYVRKKKRQGNGLHYWNRWGSKSNWISFWGLDNVDCSVNWTSQNGSSKMHVVIFSISTSASSVSNDVYRNTIDLHRCGHKNECLCERPDLYSFFPNKARFFLKNVGQNFLNPLSLRSKILYPWLVSKARKFWNENKIIKPCFKAFILFSYVLLKKLDFFTWQTNGSIFIYSAKKRARNSKLKARRSTRSVN